MQVNANRLGRGGLIVSRYRIQIVRKTGQSGQTMISKQSQRSLRPFSLINQLNRTAPVHLVDLRESSYDAIILHCQIKRFDGRGERDRLSAARPLGKETCFQQNLIQIIWLAKLVKLNTWTWFGIVWQRNPNCLLKRLFDKQIDPSDLGGWSRRFFLVLINFKTIRPIFEKQISDRRTTIRRWSTSLVSNAHRCPWNPV